VHFVGKIAKSLDQSFFALIADASKPNVRPLGRYLDLRPMGTPDVAADHAVIRPQQIQKDCGNRYE
jgi:hypothetical protein